jgi:hypothetical protein
MTDNYPYTTSGLELLKYAESLSEEYKEVACKESGIHYQPKIYTCTKKDCYFCGYRKPVERETPLTLTGY